MEILKKYQNLINEHLFKLTVYEPIVKNLYTPSFYALEGGKKIRPTLTLMACEAFGTNPHKALAAALSLEIFHNFTLVHDDIMDNSPIRRGRETIYKKWSKNQAILTGDAMLLIAFRHLYSLEQKFIPETLEILTWVGLRVSEGQQLDMEFETRTNISEQEYLTMIELKTAVLIGTALKLGAYIANASEWDQKLIYNFGKTLGLAFQIQDDYLDLYANQETFGKKIGNDIVNNKKTYLIIKALQIADDNTKNTLLNLFTTKTENNENKIQQIKEIYDNLGIKQITEQKIKQLYLEAKKSLNNIKGIDKQWEEKFRLIADYLMNREK